MKEVILIMLTVFLIACSKDPTPDDNPPKVGDNFQGGTVFYLESDNSFCLIKSGILGKACWSNNCLIEVNAFDNTHGGGYNNTNNIIAVTGNENNAAKLCKDYRGGNYDDWYLPNFEELILIQRFEFLNYEIFWSSLQFRGHSAYAIYGPQLNYPISDDRCLKTNLYSVMAVRKVVL